MIGITDNNVGEKEENVNNNGTNTNANANAISSMIQRPPFPFGGNNAGNGISFLDQIKMAGKNKNNNNNASTDMNDNITSINTTPVHNNNNVTPNFLDAIRSRKKKLDEE